MYEFRDDPARAHLLATAQLATRAANEIARSPLVAALANLELLSGNPLLPDELRERARQAAIHVADAAVHLEYLAEAFEMEDPGLEGDG